MGRQMEDRPSPILVGKFSKDRWLITYPVPCKGTQHRLTVGKLVNDVIMSGVQTGGDIRPGAIVDVRNTLKREVRDVQGSTVIPEDSPVRASAANAVIERLNEWSKLVLFIACQQGSEAMPRTRRVSKAHRSNRIQLRYLKGSRWA